MKSLVCRAYGPPSGLYLTDIGDMPMPGQRDVLVRVVAAGINYPDLLSVAGTYPIPSQPPFVPGVEGAGIVVGVGPAVARLAVGDPVCWQNNSVKGAFAEHVTLPEGCLARVPEGLDMTIAACVPTAYGTAAFALDHRAGVQPGETVVIHGASGGVGLAAVQIALSRGARVIATGRSAAKLDRLAALGAETVLVDAELRDKVMAMTGGKGVDVVLDPVGGAVFDASIRMLAPYGRLLVIGFTSGQFGIARSNILLVKALSVIGVNYGHYLQSEPEAARLKVESLLDDVAAGHLRPEVEVLEGLAAVPGALERLEQGRVFGKIAIRI
jgi:NADPH2:quinone reductase